MKAQKLHKSKMFHDSKLARADTINPVYYFVIGSKNANLSLMAGGVK